jgi:mevalonate kinase
MDEAHDLLAGLGVSCPELDQLVAAARPTSLGAKLTGAGGGGCMLALTTDPEATAEAIEMRGGRVITTPLGAPGVRIEP